MRAPSHQRLQPYCTVFEKSSIADDEARIAMRLERAGEARGISVAELSRRVGIDRKRPWRVLSGRRTAGGKQPRTQSRARRASYRRWSTGAFTGGCSSCHASKMALPRYWYRP